MTGSGMIRWGALAAMLGGLAAIVEFFVYPLEPTVAEGALLAAYVLTAGGLAGFHALHRGSIGGLGWAGLWIASAGSLLAIVATMVALAAGTDLDLVHSLGALLLIAGYMLHGVAALRARVLPSWCGLALIVVGPMTVVLIGFGDYTMLIFGLLWLMLGHMSWSRPGEPAGPPLLVS